MDIQQILSVILSVLGSLIFVCLAVLLGISNFKQFPSFFYFHFIMRLFCAKYYTFLRNVYYEECCAWENSSLFHRHSQWTSVYDVYKEWGYVCASMWNSLQSLNWAKFQLISFFVIFFEFTKQVGTACGRYFCHDFDWFENCWVK